MEFKVEDGTGLPDATSYVDLAYAEAYFTRKNLLDWWNSLNDDARKNELMNGTEYADKKFGPKLQGRPLKNDQALEFPRTGLKDRYGRPVTGVPEDIKNAVCEYAQLSERGGLHPTSAQVNQNIKAKTVKVGPITTSTEFIESSRSIVYLDHPYADSFIFPYTFGGVSGYSHTIRN